jgi:hypothetical protein
MKIYKYLLLYNWGGGSTGGGEAPGGGTGREGPGEDGPGGGVEDGCIMHQQRTQRVHANIDEKIINFGQMIWDKIEDYY